MQINLQYLITVPNYLVLSYVIIFVYLIVCYSLYLGIIWGIYLYFGGYFRNFQVTPAVSVTMHQTSSCCYFT